MNHIVKNFTDNYTVLYEFISLKDKEKWLKIIKLKKDEFCNYKRDNYFLEVRKNGYDIKECTKKLMKIYLRVGENKK